MTKLLLVLGLVASCSWGRDEPACEGAECGDPEAAPRILTISSNVTSLDERGMLVITAVVTDPDGVDDLIGGALIEPESTATYGAFATSAAEGAYEIRLSWNEIDLVKGIDAPVAGAPRQFKARFFDVAGHTAEETVTVKLHCSNDDLGVCGGDCTDLRTDPDHCGTCGNKLPSNRDCVGGMAACVMTAENTVAACSDGCSNDSDVYIDCEDFNCCTVVACPVGTACNP